MLNIARAARSRYGAVLKLPHATPLLVAVAPARAPITIMGLAMVLFVREHVGSYALAGLTAGALGVMVAIGSPLLGRMVDRVGLRAVLIPATIVNSAAFVGFVIAGLSGADAWVLVALAALAGLSLPPLGSITRALWPRIIAEGGGDPGLLATALALEGVLIEGMFTIGPLLTAAISVFLDPAVALLLAPALLIIGLVMMLPLEPVRTWRTADPDHDHGMLGALRSRGLRTLMLCMLPMGFCFGAIEVTLPAFAEDHGSRAVGGALIAAWAFGSAVGAITYGAIDWKGPLSRRYVYLAALLPIGFAPLVLASGTAVMVPLAVLCGLSIGPVLTAGNQIVSELAAQGTETEAYTWPITSLAFGIAVGNAAAGYLVTHASLDSAFVAGTGAALLAAGITLARWRTFEPPALA